MKLACLFLSVALLAGALADPIPSSEFSDLTSSQQAMYDAVFKDAEPTKETLLSEAKAMLNEAEEWMQYGLENINKFHNLFNTVQAIEENGDFTQDNGAVDVLERMAIVNDVTEYYDASGEKTPSEEGKRFIFPQAQEMYDRLFKGEGSATFSAEKLDQLAEEVLEDSRGKELSDPQWRDNLELYLESRKSGSGEIDDETVLFGMFKVNEQTGFFGDEEDKDEDKDKDKDNQKDEDKDEDHQKDEECDGEAERLDELDEFLRRFVEEYFRRYNTDSRTSPFNGFPFNRRPSGNRFPFNRSPFDGFPFRRIRFNRRRFNRPRHFNGFGLGSAPEEN